jgi:2-polyprenyl-3-methyl-5-hydroxy-6-metoxy-1,4-benzoquinol methylase
MTAEESAFFADAPSLEQTNRLLVDPMSKWLRPDKCPVCAGTRVRAHPEVRHIRYVRCRDCGLVFASPRPPQSVLDDFYNSPFYINYRQVEAAARSDDPYFSISSYRDPDELASWLAERGPRSVLDFGCGPGAFLALLRDRYSVEHVEGTELNRHSLQVARDKYGLHVVADKAHLQRSSYDAVALLEVIEHIGDVDAVLGQVAGLVRPGGWLLLSTPAVDGPLARFLPRHCPHFTGPSHISLFTERSLMALLAAHGFTPQEVRRDPASDFFSSALVACFYRLDIRSPAHMDDLSDLWYEPNRLGARLGLEAGRVPGVPGRLRRLALAADRVFFRVRDSLLGPVPDHLYVLARRDGQAAAPDRDPPAREVPSPTP